MVGHAPLERIIGVRIPVGQPAFFCYTSHMKHKLKKSTLLVLGVVSLILSRLFFVFVNDPEGPNLLIVVALAVLIYAVLIMVYKGFSKRGTHS